MEKSLKRIEMGQYPKSRQEEIKVYQCLVGSCNAICTGEIEMDAHRGSTGHCSFMSVEK